MHLLVAAVLVGDNPIEGKYNLQQDSPGDMGPNAGPGAAE
jgi:hypothetical protein